MKRKTFPMLLAAGVACGACAGAKPASDVVAAPVNSVDVINARLSSIGDPDAPCAASFVYAAGKLDVTITTRASGDLEVLVSTAGDSQHRSFPRLAAHHDQTLSFRVDAPSALAVTLYTGAGATQTSYSCPVRAG